MVVRSARNPFISISLLVVLTLLLPAGSLPTAAQPEPPSPPAGPVPAVPDQGIVTQALHSSPIMFIENVGQFDERARFQVRGGSGTIWLAEDALWITVVERTSPPAPPLRGEGSEPPAALRSDGSETPPSLPGKGAGELGQGVNLRLSFPGANPHPRLEPFDRLDTVVSFFIGNDPAKWRPDVPAWGGVRYVDLYPGMDLEITSEGGQWQWRLVASTPSPAAATEGSAKSGEGWGGGVILRVEGADAVALDGDALRLGTAAGETTLPLLTLERGNVERANVKRLNAQTFDVTAPFAPVHSNRQSAIANPQSPADNPADLLYSTFLGGSSDDDLGYAIAVDGAGSAYVTGYTYSSDFPTTPGAFDPSFNGGVSYSDAFVVKLNPAGSGLAYAYFLGGSSDDYGYGIAVDGVGSAYVTGSTLSSDFPTTPGAFDPSFNGYYDAFVVKLDPTGSGLAYATFLGGASGNDWGSAIAVDEAGSAYVTGATNSPDFPTTPGAFDPSYNGGNGDAFVVKLDPTGSGLAYATFLGGSSWNWSGGIAVDAAGSAYVTGFTGSSDFPTTPGAFDPSFNGSDDAFVVKLNPAGSGLAYATFLGGLDFDRANGIAVDGAGSAYVTGYTNSTDFPTTPGAFDTSFNGGDDAFVVKLNLAGSGLAYATFLGGSEDWACGTTIAVDGSGRAYVTGVTSSSDFPTTPGAFDTSFNGGDDAFVVKLNPAGSGLAYATFLGSSSSDGGSAIAVDEAGSAYVSGPTGSGDFPTTPGAFDTSYNGGYHDAFVVKLAMGGGGAYAIAGRVTDGGDQPLAGVTVSDGAGHTATTDGNGNYTLTGLSAGTYTITPSKTGYSFSPPSRTVTVPPNAAGLDFIGTSILSPVSQGSLRLIASSSYNLAQPIVPAVSVENLTSTLITYTVVISLLQNEVNLETLPEWDVAIPGCESTPFHYFSFGPRPTGIYRIKAELRAEGKTLATMTKGVVVYLNDAQISASAQASMLTDAAQQEFNQVQSYVTDVLADSEKEAAKNPHRFVLGQMLDQSLDQSLGAFGVPEADAARTLISAFFAVPIDRIAEEAAEGGRLREEAERSVRSYIEPGRQRISAQEKDFVTEIESRIFPWTWQMDLEGFKRALVIGSVVETTPYWSVVIWGPPFGLPRPALVSLSADRVNYLFFRWLVPVLGWVVVAVAVVVFVVALLVNMGMVVRTGDLAVRLDTAQSLLVGWRAYEPYLECSIAFVLLWQAQNMNYNAEHTVVPAITQAHQDSLQALLGLIDGGMDAATTQLDTGIHLASRQATFAAVLTNTGNQDARPLVNTDLYTLDGRLVDMLSTQLSLRAGQTQVLSYPLSLYSTVRAETG